MRKRFRIGLGLDARDNPGRGRLARFREPSEPVYRGKTLSVWMEGYLLNGRQDAETDDAVRQIGTNAIPTLLRMLRASDSKWKQAVVRLVSEQDWVRIRLPLSWWGAYFPTREAAEAFGALGPSASNAVPELIEIYRDNVGFDSQFGSLWALGKIGPAANQAIPYLVEASTNTNQFIRYRAIDALANLHAKPEMLVPILINGLGDTNDSVRFVSSKWLATFGPEAKAAVPALAELIEDRYPWVATNAMIALKAIDPEAAAKAGVK